MNVKKIYMTITSMKDGHTVWPLEVIRKEAAGFDIAIGTEEMKEGHEYLVRVSNNINLSPSASTSFKIEKSSFPLPLLLPIIFSPLFIKKYQDKGIRDVEGLTEYLKSQGLTDNQIKEEITRILSEIQMDEEIRIPIDLDREILEKKWVTQMDARVCKYCFAHTLEGENNDGVWTGGDSDAPKLPEHPKCRCTYDLRYKINREAEFRAAAVMARIPDLELITSAIKVIKNLN